MAENEGRMTIFSHHNDNLRIRKLPGLDAQAEAAKGLLHRWIGISSVFVDPVLIARFGDPESERFLTKAEILRGDVAIEEDVDAFADALWQSNNPVYRRLPVKYADKVTQVVEDTQICQLPSVLDFWKVKGVRPCSTTIT